MFGTLTLQGKQTKNIFTADNGMQFKIANSWVIPTMSVERYVLLQKEKNDYWYLIRSVDIKTNKL